MCLTFQYTKIMYFQFIFNPGVTTYRRNISIEKIELCLKDNNLEKKNIQLISYTFSFGNSATEFIQLLDFYIVYKF